jgi:hypothetical protein
MVRYEHIYDRKSGLLQVKGELLNLNASFFRGFNGMPRSMLEKVNLVG